MLLFLKILIVGVILYFISKNIALVDSADAILSVSWPGVALAMAFLIVQQFIVAFRLMVVAPMFGGAVRLWPSIRISLESLFFSQTFVSFIGGDMARVLGLRAYGGLDIKNATSAVLLDRLAGVISNHLLVLVFLPLLYMLLDSTAMRMSLLLFVGGVTALLVLVALFGLLPLAGPSGIPRPRWLRRVEQAYRVFLEMATLMRFARSHPQRFLSLLLLGGAVNSLNVLAIMALLWALDAPVSLLEAFTIVPVVLEMAMLPISLAGWGVREGMMVVGFGTVGVAGHSALASSVLFGLLSIVLGLTGMLSWLGSARRRGVRAPSNAATVGEPGPSGPA